MSALKKLYGLGINNEGTGVLPQGTSLLQGMNFPIWLFSRNLPLSRYDMMFEMYKISEDDQKDAVEMYAEYITDFSGQGADVERKGR